MRWYIFIVAVYASFFVGCSHSRIPAELSMAEALMEQRPDSAYQILKRMDSFHLKGEALARYNLLLSQALNENHKHETDESRIAVAVNYYIDSDDDYHKMLSLYYLALVKHNSGLENEALHYALDALDIAERLNDAGNLFRIKSLIGTVYEKSDNSHSAYQWNLQALKIAKNLNRKDLISAAYYSIAKNAYSLQQFQESLTYADSAAHFSPVDDSKIAELQTLNYQLLENDSAASIEIANLHIINPLERVEQAHAKKLYRQEADRKLAAQRFSLALAFIIILLLIITWLIIIYIRKAQKARQLESERNFALLITSLEQQIQSLKDNQEDSARESFKPLVSQFSLFNKVGDASFKTRIDKCSKETGFDQIISEMQRLAKEKAILHDINEIISLYNPEFEQGIENLNLLPSEYELVIYSLFGLSTQVIALLMDKSERAVYNLKSRTKKKLTENSTPITMEILKSFTK